MLENILGWMTDYEIKILTDIGKSLSTSAVIVEIGSLFGRSSVAWAEANPSAKIYCIDTFSEEYIPNHLFSDEICKKNNFPLNGLVYNVRELFIENTRDYKNIVMIQGYSPYSVQIPFSEIDLLFLDASHKNPNDWENIEYFLPYIKSNGIISGHDFLPDVFPDVVENVERLEILLNKKATVYKNTSIWTIKK